MSKLHICFLTNEYPQAGITNGGIGTFIKTLAEQLVQAGHQVSVVGHTNERKVKRMKINEVDLHLFPASKVSGLAWLFNFRKTNKFIEQIHKSSPIDIVEGAELAFAFIKKIPGIKYIIRLHGGHHFFAEGENREIQKWKGFQEKRSFKQADGFIAVSNYVKFHTGNLLSFHGKSPQVIYNAIELGLFDGKLSANRSEFDIVFVGTVCEKKGIRQLCFALKDVIKAFPSAILHVYGRDWHFSNGASYQSWLKTQLDEDVQKNIRFHGPVEHKQLKDIYGKATVCAFPSHSETLGLVAPEAMAMKAPVVFTQMGPGSEIIEDGVDGWLADPLNPDSIAEKLLVALSNKKLCQEIGERARIRVLKQFDPITLLNQNIKFYDSLINS